MHTRFLVLTAGVLLSLATSSYAAGLPQLKDGELSPARDCGACHTEIHGMWKDSLHSQAVSDPIFKTAYMEAYLESKGASSKLCLSCHAPSTLVNGDFDLDKAVTKEGVTCHFCHSLVDANPDAHPQNSGRFTLDVGETIRGPHDSKEGKAHNIEHSELHKRSVLCAGCHEYKANGITIMGTYSEWLKGPYAAKGIHCQSCHMPLEKVGVGAGKTLYSHYLAGGHSIDQLKKAIHLTVNRIERERNRVVVELELENVGSGHYVPTGIPSRKLVLTCSVANSSGGKASKKLKYEKVIFDKDGHELTEDYQIMMGKGTQVVKDNRLAPGEKRIERLVFYVEPTGEISVSASIDYLYQPKVIDNEEMKIEMNRTEKMFRP